jgi:hypothetical protein
MRPDRRLFHLAAPWVLGALAGLIILGIGQKVMAWVVGL